MFKNYFKVALRTFRKQKLTTGINVFSLSIGIACASLAFVFIRHELTYDRFHAEHENIYWLTTTIQQTINLAGTPGVLGPALKANLPEVTSYTRLEKQEISVPVGQELFKESALFVEPNFFSFFDFPLVSGAKDQVLANPKTVVLSEDMARKYFGRENPLGETLTIFLGGEQALYEVTGVAKNAPTNSSIQFQFLFPIQDAYQDQPAALDSEWESFTLTSFIRLRERNDLIALQEKLPAFAKDQYEGASTEKFSFVLRALDDYHLNDGMIANGLTMPGDQRYVHILAIIALLILLVACFNFMNLSNAKGSQRLMEVGVRQILGAHRQQLTAQFLTESVLLSLLSLGVAIVLIEAFLPFTTQLVGYPLEVNWTEPVIFLPLLGIAVVTGLVAGAYPAALLSKLKAIATFRSDYKIGGNNWVTKSSLVFQFALSIGLFSCTLIMYQQQQFIQNRNLGFNQEEIVVIPTQVQPQQAADTERLLTQYRTAVQALPGVVAVTGVSHSFNRGNRGRSIQAEDGSQDFVFEYRVDPNYLELLHIELLEGRNFSEATPTDQTQAVIVNEAFLRKYEIDEPLAHRLPSNFDAFANVPIVGVVKDYHYNHLRTAIAPMLLHMRPDVPFGHMLVKIKSQAVQQTLTQLREHWQSINPDQPFEFSFLDEDLQQQYVAESRWSKVITGATLFAILIAFLGLFGLVALSLAQRAKEIGIRKVLGASVAHIVRLFSADFLKLVVVAILVAAPLAWYLMQQWLDNFAYRIDIAWWVFVLAGCTAIGMALLTVSVQSMRTALTNPVKSLRSE